MISENRTTINRNNNISNKTKPKDLDNQKTPLKIQRDGGHPNKI